MLTDSTAQEIFLEIQAYYDSIDYPKHRNANLKRFRKEYQRLLRLKAVMENQPEFIQLMAAMSQIVTRFDEKQRLQSLSDDEIWSNYSERGMNKVIPVVHKHKGIQLPFEWSDRWGYQCSINHGYWSAKNYRVMDALGYMLLLSIGGDQLPKERKAIFNDLGEIDDRERLFNSKLQKLKPEDGSDSAAEVRVTSTEVYSIGFTDTDFRKMTGLKLKSAEVLQLLVEMARVEFKLSFPVRLISTGDKETLHQMNYFSRLFEIGYEDVQVRKDGIVQHRRYRVVFNTLLGELFVNNLKAGYNDRIPASLYLLPDSAQVFYRRHLVHNNYKRTEIYLSTIAESVGMRDTNRSNLTRAIVNNVLQPLQNNGFIESFSLTDGLAGQKVIIEKRGGERNSKFDCRG